MGNQCYAEKEIEVEDKQKTAFLKKLNKLNNNLLAQLSCSQMINFHKNIVALLIQNCNKPQQLLSMHYDSESRLEFCQRLKLKISANQKSFFNLLIGNYFVHFNEDLSKEHVIDFIQQFDTISQMLRTTVMTGFGYDLKLYFGNNLDKLPEQELLVQRILQHYLLGKTSPIKKQFNQLLSLYYQQLGYDQLSQSNIPEKGTVLEQNDFEIDQALIPIKGGEEANISNDSFLESSGGSVRRVTVYNPISNMNNILEQTEQNFKEIPYMKTFEILSQMINTTKPWKKFLLIEKFDNLITKTFLTNRDQSEMNNLQELLFAEDSRSDIYLFIFHQFGQQYKVDFKEYLLNSLKLMWEFDGLLCSDVKYIYCPCFLRFTNVLEMYIQYNEQLQYKQS